MVKNAIRAYKPSALVFPAAPDFGGAAVLLELGAPLELPPEVMVPLEFGDVVAAAEFEDVADVISVVAEAAEASMVDG